MPLLVENKPLINLAPVEQEFKQTRNLLRLQAGTCSRLNLPLNPQLPSRRSNMWFCF